VGGAYKKRGNKPGGGGVESRVFSDPFPRGVRGVPYEKKKAGKKVGCGYSGQDYVTSKVTEKSTQYEA